MNDFFNQVILPILALLSVGVIGFALAFVKKVWSAIDSYFETKAVNYATKQDVALITEKTEEVQALFKKDMEEFNADLQFKYKMHEIQYSDLYSKLYQIICKSESFRYLLLKQNVLTSFEEVPIVELANKESNIVQEIIDLVNNEHAKATPELVKIVNLLDVFEHIKYSREYTEDDEKLVIKIKANLVKTILKDCHWLRTQLQLPYCEEEIEHLDTDSFLIETL